MKEINIKTWELPDYVSSEKNITIKEITLITKSIEYNLYTRQPQLEDYNKVKRMVASELASFVLDSMKYVVTEDYSGNYIHKFQTRCLTEKEKSEYMTEISNLKAELEYIKEESEYIKKESGLRKNINISLQFKLDKVKNYSFWERVKFLFKKKGELL